MAKRIKPKKYLAMKNLKSLKRSLAVFKKFEHVFGDSFFEVLILASGVSVTASIILLPFFDGDFWISFLVMFTIALLFFSSSQFYIGKQIKQIGTEIKRQIKGNRYNL